MASLLAKLPDITTDAHIQIKLLHGVAHFAKKDLQTMSRLPCDNRDPIYQVNWERPFLSVD